jgi:3-oxoacyl-[acyl-carrier protein] reductase
MSFSKKILSDKTAIITGCLKGIGKEVVSTFAENGADIFACCEKEDSGFLDFIKELEKQNKVRIIPIYFDLIDYDAIKNSIQYISSFKKPIDILVNVAGMTSDAFFNMILIFSHKCY